MIVFFSDERNTGITLHAAKYSSEDAAQIVEYIQLVIQFSRKYQPYMKSVQMLEGLKQEKEDQTALLMAQNMRPSEENVNDVKDFNSTKFCSSI